MQSVATGTRTQRSEPNQVNNGRGDTSDGPRLSPYQEWQEREGVPIIQGFYVEDLNTLELAPWARKGGQGTFVNLDGAGGHIDAYVCEIPPGQALQPQRHMFEETIFVLSGRGSTSVWYDEGRKQRFEWGAGSLFALPLNAHYQHFNASGQQSARYVAVTTAPIMINLIHNQDFIFQNPYRFTDRFDDESEYFKGDGRPYGVRGWETNFIPDVRAFQLTEWRERGAGGAYKSFELAHNTSTAHVSRFPPATYKKAHRHGPGAHVIILDGLGYSLLWPEGEERRRVDWKPGTMVVPPQQWFHQHFNTGGGPARYLALRWGSMRYRLKGPGFSEGEGAGISVKAGGGQIEYEDEDPEIHREFEADLIQNGATCQMGGMVPWCTGVPGRGLDASGGE